MRPIRLEMSAFGPYAHTQVVNFLELGHRTLFLISGPTGSGKTTLLDAICLALYGQTAAEKERRQEETRSAFAPDDLLTKVTLDFSIHDKTYRVMRIPGQIRTAKRSDRKVEQTPDATLWDRTLAENEDDDGVVKESGTRPVNLAIEKLIQLNATQFRQVVLLPQGQFRKFLLAPSEDREKILKALFGTEWCESIERELRDRARELKIAFNQAQTQRTTLLESVEVEDEKQLDTRLEVTTSEYTNVTNSLKKLQKDSVATQQAVTRAKEVQNKLAEHERAVKRREELEKQRPEMGKREVLHQEGTKAAGLVDAEKLCVQRKKDVKTRLNAREEAAKEKDSALKATEEATNALETSKKAEPEREKLVGQIKELDSKKGKVAALAAKQKDMEEAGKVATHATSTLESLQASTKTLAAREKDLRAKLEKARLAGVGSKDKQEALDRLERLRKNISRLGQLGKDLIARKQAAKNSTAKAEAKKIAFEKAEAKSERIQADWDSSQAEVLARQLKDAEPCPVCGSTEHPAPAESGEEPPTEVDVNTARKSVVDARTNLDQARKAFDEDKLATTKVQATIEELLQTLGKEAKADPKELAQRVRISQESLEAASKAAREVEVLETQLLENKTEIDTNAKKVEEAGIKVKEANERLSLGRGEVTQLEKDVEPEWREAGGLKKEITKITNRQKSMKKAHESVLATDKKSRERWAKAISTFSAAGDELEKATNVEREGSAAFTKRVAEAGFERLESYEAAKMDSNALEKLKQQIQEWKEGFVAAKETEKRTNEAARQTDRRVAAARSVRGRRRFRPRPVGRPRQAADVTMTPSQRRPPAPRGLPRRAPRPRPDPCGSHREESSDPNVSSATARACAEGSECL